ncbi:MAG: DNA polymerase I, partial [Alphaproteobacteria bacterium]|nr:DNA polymerase I [Alphaproteobacteria bacterium]
DVQALAGDSTDNIPGVPGIGVKTAAELINDYGTLDDLLARAEEITQPKRRENLITYADQARLSRELVTLKQDAPRPIDFSDMRLQQPEPAALMGFLKAMEFNTLTKRMGKRYALDPNDFEPIELPQDKLAKSKTKDKAKAKPQNKKASGQGNNHYDSNHYENRDSDNREEVIKQIATPMPPIAPATYECVTDKAILKNWIEAAQTSGIVAVDTETDGLDAMACRLVGISLATAPGQACYIPLAHGQSDGLALAEPAPQQLSQAEVVKALSPLLADKSVLKILQNAKFDLQVLGRHGLHVAPLDDTMLLSYTLAAGQHGHGLDELAQLYLNHTPIAIKDLLGTGKTQITFDQVPLDKATAYAAEDADITLRLWHCLKREVVLAGMVSVYETTERPLVPVIVAMEGCGVRIDRPVLARLSVEFAEKMATIEKKIHTVAGEPFNIASPRQLGHILFDKMSFAGGKKTKTGAWATSANILEGLAAQGHDLPALVLDWRALAKLKSTYTDALPSFIHAETGRIHTSYGLAGTTTGRLASSEPNLQNIPIRTEDGRRIRTAFIAERNHKLVSADYSQIELRLLAHIADIKVLKQAFADGIDIHSLTASEIFGVPVADMPAETRRRAKAINFGIIYGISPFGLANQLRIPQAQARDYMKSYFAKFPGIKDYMEATKAQAHAQGYVTTIFGRKIYLAEINAKQPARRAFAERAAINAPIQGSAADIIRRAMIALPPALKEAGLKARMLLQVHDELIFEVANSEVKPLIALAKEIMEAACAPRLALSVPLIVDAKAAPNWDEAH